ncbi:MAG: DUF6350 family protein [Corynebacterium variabile]|nr:DUF6350 family protein [Corynebacterium variabile]
MNNESHRPSPRSRNTGRGSEERRRRAGTSGPERGTVRSFSRNASRSSTTARDTSRASTRGVTRDVTRGGEGFVDGAHGADPRDPRQRAAARASGRPASQGRFGAFWSVWGPHIRRFGPGILLNHGVTVAVALVIAVVLAIGTTFRAVPAYIGSVWLLSNLAPVTISGASLGVAPLLPALLIFVAHSRRIRTTCGTTVTVRGIRTVAVLGILVPAVFTLIAWLMVWDASKVFDVAPPNIFLALLTTVLLNGAVVIAGLGPKIWRALLLRRGMPTWPVESVLLADRFFKVLLLVGAAVAAIGLLVNHAAVGRAYDIAGGAGGVLGLTLLSLVYFPNLAVGATSVIMGGEMHIGDGSASLFAVTNANMPPLPVLAVMPNDSIPLGPVWLLIPAVAAVVTVYRWFAGRRFIESPLFTAMGAGLCAAVAGLLIAWFAGGELGYYGSTGPLLWLTPLLFLGWMVLPSLVVFGWVAWSGRRVTESAGDFADDYVDDEAAEDVEEAAAEEDISAGSADDDSSDDEEEAAEEQDTEEDAEEEPTSDDALETEASDEAEKPGDEGDGTAEEDPDDDPDDVSDEADGTDDDK